LSGDTGARLAADLPALVKYFAVVPGAIALACALGRDCQGRPGKA